MIRLPDAASPRLMQTPSAPALENRPLTRGPVELPQSRPGPKGLLPIADVFTHGPKRPLGEFGPGPVLAPGHGLRPLGEGGHGPVVHPHGLRPLELGPGPVKPNGLHPLELGPGPVKPNGLRPLELGPGLIKPDGLRPLPLGHGPVVHPDPGLKLPLNLMPVMAQKVGE